MKPEDVFYYSEKKGWFTKHALSVERVGFSLERMTRTVRVTTADVIITYQVVDIE